MDYKQQSSLTNTQNASGVIRNGPVNLRKRRAFNGITWKPRRLELHIQTLTIINPVNNKRSRIELRDISELERSDLSDHCLRLKARGKVYNFSFVTDPELYDWQDDIYQRCPLGNYSAPFDFVHKSHIGTDNVTGTFTDPNILPIYAEIVSGQPVVSKTSSGIIATPRSRPPSGLSPLPLNAKPIQKTSLSPSGPGSLLLEGRYGIKHTRFFPSWIWRERWLSVTSQSIVVHRGNTKKSSPSKNIYLFNLTRVEPDADKEGCLVVEYSRPRQPPRSTGGIDSRDAGKSDTLMILFNSYDELYTWRDALYDRSPLSAPIGNPTGFKHNTHVGYDPLSGAFMGLPTEWQSANPTPSTVPATLTAEALPMSTNKLRRRQSKRKPTLSAAGDVPGAISLRPTM